MSLHQLANHMAAHGRGPDDHLVHMSGKEVAGLQALANMHGGSLTRNPSTGLPEAGFLDSLLPTLVGAAGMYFGVPPEVTAGVMGLGTAAHTGDLGKGIMAGMGAYGGGNMMQGAMDSGLIGSNAVPAAPNVAAPSAAGLAGPSPEGITQGLNARDDLLLNTGNENARDALLARTVPQDQMASQLMQTTASNAAMPITAQNLGGWGNIGMAAAPVLMDAMTPNKATPAGTNQMIRPYTFAANPQTQGDMVGGKPMIGTKYTPGQDTSERQWFNPQYTALTPYKAAQGGLMDLSHGGLPVERMSAMANATNDTNDDSNRFAAGGGISGLMGYAEGGSLGGYSDGGQMLKGPGDGMSDNIPAQIGDKQPARLADGEFVVPADVVSHLGNGSTDAGAKQLYKMMDKVRSARTGRKAQGKQINPSKFVPA